jgi:hypothetical protein
VGESDHSPQSDAEIKNCGAIPRLPIPLHGDVLKYLSTGTNLTLPCFIFKILPSVEHGDFLFISQIQMSFLA